MSSATGDHQLEPLELASPALAQTPSPTKARETHLQRALRIVNEQYFIVGAVFAVCVAAAYPPLGRNDGPLDPSITTGIVAVAIIFFISGLTLRSSELKDAMLYVRFNTYVLFFNMVLFPVVTFAIANLLKLADFNPALVDGLIIMGCMPTAISMSVVFTKSAGGNEAAALFNSTAGNLIGIIASPLWLLLLVNASSSVSLGETILQLVYKAIVPLVVGQVIRYLPIAKIQPLLQKHKQNIKRLSETMLILIIYTTFANMFYHGTDASTVQVVELLFLVLAMYTGFTLLAWWSSGWKWLDFAAEDRITSLFTCANKTAALGIPLINTIYDGNPNLGLYTVPLLLYYPCQLIIGSFLTTPLRKWVEDRQQLTESPQV